MNVRRLSPDDWRELAAVRLRGLEEHPLEFGADVEDEKAWPEARWRQSLMDMRWFAVEQDGALIGCALLRIPEGRKLRHNGWINAMYVAIEAQGSGAAAALISAIEAEARAMSVSILKLYVRAGNERAIRLYARAGFHVYGREPASHVYGDRAFDSLELAKPLDERFAIAGENTR
jgi:ribosomal protein S18 acetylase RimI-like enzyme